MPVAYRNVILAPSAVACFDIPTGNKFIAASLTSACLIQLLPFLWAKSEIATAISSTFSHKSRTASDGREALGKIKRVKSHIPVLNSKAAGCMAFFISFFRLTVRALVSVVVLGH